ncbi:hypothetical protein [Chamaesiphon sp. VAR_69_metabat_338]|uniref:hypothetical protein n=1 Tax=Chamaesiphon sp. VAR_69_metabat_338 TaxID=2964704 RepID=UPI00286DD7AE|nr:hypothetical protein [Chamaesiphon sp. VAR_69_metabat_338]
MNSSQIEIDSLNVKSMSTLKYYQLSSIAPPHEGYFHKTKARMLQLKKYHKISQEYTLPIPYLCQVYHLLNLKHLEQVHNLSLKGLKVGNVSQFEETTSGGSVRFKTSLNQSINVLRMWRQPIVEAELTLHTPYTIELAIPVYNNCKIIILFNILPLGDNAHKLFIDIYSDLEVPKPILQLVFHCAACVTLVEDLPYLYKLANANLYRRVKSIGVSNRDTMKLFKRYVDLYGSSLEQPGSIGAIELCPLAASTVAC